MTSTCPTCGKPSSQVTETFTRTFPEPAVTVTRFRCGTPRCGSVPTDKRRKTTWDEESPIGESDE